MQRRELPQGWDKGLPIFPADPKGIAGRDALQAAHYAIGDRVGQTLAPQCGRLRDSNAAPATAIVISTDDAGGTATNTAVGVDREDRSTA